MAFLTSGSSMSVRNGQFFDPCDIAYQLFVSLLLLPTISHFPSLLHSFSQAMFDDDVTEEEGANEGTALSRTLFCLPLQTLDPSKGIT